MNLLATLEWPVSGAAVERLGWVLVHSLWQFALVALLTGAIVLALCRNSARSRHGVLILALAMTVAAPVATWLLLPGDKQFDQASGATSVRGWEQASRSPPSEPLDAVDALLGQRQGESSDASTRRLGLGDSADAWTHRRTDVAPLAGESALDSDTNAVSQSEPTWSETIRTALRPWLAWIVIGWSLGVVICSFRPLLGWHTLRRLRRVGTSPVSDDVLAVLRRVSARLGLRHTVRVLQSTLAQVPLVVGYVRPVILLPVSLLTTIPVAQLEAILAHELAHVARHDFVVNLLQTLVETLFFYHPAVWWLSGQIRIEREHSCDDLVVTLLGNRVEYGRALVAIEQLRSRNSVLALGAADGSLLSRVRRILGLDSNRAAVRLSDRWPVATVSLVCLGLAIVLSMSWSLAAKDAGELLSGQKTAVIVTAAKPSQPDEQDGAKTDARRDGSDIVNAIDPIEGEVVDAVTGNRIEGATVRFRFRDIQRRSDWDDKPVAELVFRDVGRFTFRLPNGVDPQMRLIVERTAEHPDYQSLSPAGPYLQDVLNNNPTYARDSIRKVALSPGKVVTGRVMDLDGSPAVGIPVESGRNRQGWQNGCVHKTTTDAAGRYRLVVPANHGRGRIYVTPNDASAVSRAITTDFGEQPPFKLLHGTRLHGKAVDAEGRGIAGLVVRANGGERIPWRYAVTDAEGRYSLPPCQYGKYVVELVDETWIPELRTTGAKLPDVYLPQVVELSKTAPTEQVLDIKPTESVRVAAHYTGSDDKPVPGRRLALQGSLANVHWSGRFREVPDEPGLFELRVPRGLQGRFDPHDSGRSLRIVRQPTDDALLAQQEITKFDQDGISFRVRGFRFASVTLRAAFEGRPVEITNYHNPKFDDTVAAKQIGAREAYAGTSTEPATGARRFVVHPDIDIVLKLELPGFRTWQETVRIPEGENKVIEVALEPQKETPPKIGAGAQEKSDPLRETAGENPAAAMTLEAAVAAVNKQIAQMPLDVPSVRTPPIPKDKWPAALTVDEVVAAIRNWDRVKHPVADETYRIFERIADTRLLPPKASLRFWTQWLDSDRNDKFEYRVWNIGLDVSTGENTGYGLAIRHLVLDWRIALRPCRGHSWLIAPRPPLAAGKSTLVWDGIVVMMEEDRDEALVVITERPFKTGGEYFQVVAFDDALNRYDLSRRRFVTSKPGSPEEHVFERFRLDPKKLARDKVQYFGIEAADAGDNFSFASAPPKGLEFLAPYPKLHGLSLDMTEPQFLEIAQRQELKPRKSTDDAGVQYSIPTRDGHIVIVMFKAEKCSGIQRIRGDAPAPNEKPREEEPVTSEKPPADAKSKPAPLEFRVAANPADGKLEPRVPADFEKRHYPDNSAAGRAAAKDKGFIWIRFADPKDGKLNLPLQGVRGAELRMALLADTAEHAMAWDGTWSVEECRVVPDPSGDDYFGVELTLNEAGGMALRALTKSHLNQPLAIIVDGEIIAAPVIRSEIGRAVHIVGDYTREQAEALAAAIDGKKNAQRGASERPAAAAPDDEAEHPNLKSDKKEDGSGGKDDLANSLDAMIKQPSLGLLKQLLAAAGTKQPEPVELLDEGRFERVKKGANVKLIGDDPNQVAIVVARVRPVIGDEGGVVENYLQRLPECAFVFDRQGRFIATLGGKIGTSRANSPSPERIEILSLGPVEDWFVRVTRFEYRDEFEFQSEYYRIANPVVNSLRYFHYANSNPWSWGPEKIPRYGTLHFDFPRVSDKLAGGATSLTNDGVAVNPIITWDGDRNRFVGAPAQRAKDKPLYYVDAEWSRDFEPLAPKRDQLIVSGGARREEHWHSWESVVPERFEAVVTLTIPQREGPSKVVRKTYRPGAAILTLHDTPDEESSSASLELYKFGEKKESFDLPCPLGDRPATHPPIVQVLNPGESARLLTRPLATSSEPLIFEIKLQRPGTESGN